MRKLIPALLCIYFSISFTLNSNAQNCDVNVPTYYIDLSSNPDSTWYLFEEDADDRSGYCCGSSGSDECIRFEITLHPDAAGIFFNYDGAPAIGSLGWRVDCGPEHSMKDTICITDPGPFTLSFCKPGSDNGNYSLISVAKPTFPEDQTVPLNCVKPVHILGVTADSPSWQSISPGAPGDYDHLLSCTDCLDPIFTPDPSVPSEIEYRVCGYPILDYCVGDSLFCDTVKFTILDSLILQASPTNPTFCAGGSVQLHASAQGGDGNYNFIWYDNGLNIVGTGPDLDVSVAGTYTVEVRDGNYEPGFCDDFFKSLTVTQTNPPSVDVGGDVVLCAENPSFGLYSNVTNSSSVLWSGGAGTFSPSNTDPFATYTATSSEIASGSVELILSSTGALGGCAEDADTVVLFFTDSLASTLEDMEITCFDGELAVNANISGGMAPYQYLWSDGSKADNNTFGVGTHCLSVSDGLGCSFSTCFTISSPTELVTSNSSTPVTTNGGSDGTATVNASGGTAPYTYSWSNGGTTATITGLSYGIYTVTVTDANGCERTSSVVVNEPRCNGYFVSTSSSDLSCNGDGSGEATAIPNNGASPFSFQWDDALAQTSETATGLSQGVYQVVVTDANGCIAMNTASIFEPSALMNTITSSDVTVQGGNDGSATANVSGGTSPYDFLWSNGSTSSSISGVVAGWYNVTISDDHGCSMVDSIYINEPPCNEMSAQVSTTSPLCAGDATAEANLVVMNGVGPYSIAWSTGENGVDQISDLAADLYSVEVVDSRGCYVFKSFGVSEPSPISVGLSATPSTCMGADNGTIDASIVGGTYPYYYFDWSNGHTTEDVINLGVGAYSLTVTDENGCSTIASTSISEPSDIEISYVSTNVTCYQGSDGSIDVTTTGGTVPYNFDWSNGATTEDLNGIDVGGYILSVTDANFCTIDMPVSLTILEPEQVAIDVLDIACPIPGENNATVTVTPIGGTPDYTVSFDGGVTFQTVGDFDLNLETGMSHEIIIHDLNGCSSISETVDLDPTVSLDEVDFDPCYAEGQVQADLNITASGGNGSYTYSTDNGVTFGSSEEAIISVGIDSPYTVLVQDGNGCLSLPMNIVLPSFLDNQINITQDYNGENISCHGMNDGGLLGIAIGGTPPYIYAWGNDIFAPENENLGAGTYNLIIQDANGCLTFGSEKLTEPDELLSAIDVISDYNGEDISCNGSGDGSSEVSPEGGVAPYNILWSDGQTGAIATNLAAGDYDVTITDQNGCETVNAIQLTEPDLLEANAEITNVSCNDGSDGAIDINVDGGTTPYAYNWYFGPTTQDVDNLIAGTYNVQITDLNGCLIKLANLVVQPTNMVISGEIIQPSCFGFADGSVNVLPTGGIAPYTFEWDNGEVTQSVDNIDAGDHTVMVTDANGCIQPYTATVDEPSQLEASAVVLNNSCFELGDGSIVVTPSEATPPYDFDWSNGGHGNAIDALAAGEYTVTVTDAQGCALQLTYQVTQPDLLTVDLSSPLNFHEHNISFYGGNDGSISTAVNGGTGPYIFDWSNGDVDADINGLTAGNYAVTVIDNLGCEANAVITLREPFNLEMPTAFSPNNDGDNDFFEIRGIDAYPDNKLIVTNRWGNVVFETEGYKNDWKGITNRGKELPDGVYFVILEINGKQITKNNYLHIKRY